MRRVVLFALLAAAAGAVVLVLAPDVPESAYRLGERIGDGSVPGADARILVRGIAERYDYAPDRNASLLLLEWCSHVLCGPAVLVLDATADRMREEDGPWILVPVGDEPVGITTTPRPLQGHGPGGESYITEMFSTTYDARAAWPYAFAGALGVALAAGGLAVAVARGRSAWALGGAAVAAAALGAWVAYVESSWPLLILTLPLYPAALGLALLTVGLLLFKRRWDVAFTAFVCCVAYLAALYLVEDWYGFWGAGD